MQSRQGRKAQGRGLQDQRLQARRFVVGMVIVLGGGALFGPGCTPATSSAPPKDGGATGGRASGGSVGSSGGSTGSGGVSSSGGAGGTGGSLVGSGGSFGSGGSLGSGGEVGTGGDTGAGGTGGDSGSGGMGGMGLLISCSVQQAQAAGVVVALNEVISDFTYTDGTTEVQPTKFSFGNFFDSPSGYGFHYPDLPVSTGGQGGAAGAGGAGGGAPLGGRGGGGGPGGQAGAAGGRGGGAMALGPAGLAEDFTGSDWHVTGVVGTYSAFALNMACITDASMFTGIEFTIRGNAGTPNRLTVVASFSGDEPGSFVTPGLGMCLGTCTAPSTVVNVTGTKTLVQIPWSSFTGGRPIATVNPAQLTGLRWTFAWGGAGSTPYPVDVHVDDLHFMTAVSTPDGGVADVP